MFKALKQTFLDICTGDMNTANINIMDSDNCSLTPGIELTAVPLKPKQLSEILSFVLSISGTYKSH